MTFGNMSHPNGLEPSKFWLGLPLLVEKAGSFRPVCPNEWAAGARGRIYLPKSPWTKPDEYTVLFKIWLRAVPLIL